MATFLTSSRMNPALAARIESSIRGRGVTKAHARFAPRFVALVRLGALAVLVGVVGWLVLALRSESRELERARRALLEAVSREAASLTAHDREFVARVESWLVQSSGAYPGDFVADELRLPGALAALLGRSAVYVRGPIDAFTHSAGVAAAASESDKDALLLCLVEPPASRAEKDLLGKVYAAYSGGADLERRTGNVRRLQEVRVGLPVLSPEWAERVRSAGKIAEIARLQREFERAPIKRAKQAASAAILLFAMDEPNEPGGVTEIDGEHAHHVRVGIVDLAVGKMVLRVRKRVDPSWISEVKRPEYARGLDGCLLALDVRKGM